MRAIIALLRLDKPIGIWLVFFPAGWAVALAARPGDIAHLELVMLLGAVLTRSAGCVLNDLADRRLDRAVARTRDRPLASGKIGVPAAVAVLFLLLLAALAVALQLPVRVFWLSLAAVPMIAAYPWMKRITWWPQLFLGLTFNLSALFGWLATGAPLGTTPFLLYAAAILWTLGYDTIYAVQDMADDAAAGIKSTARRFAAQLPAFVGTCYTAMFLLLAVCLIHQAVGHLAWTGFYFAMLQAAWQWRLLPSSPAMAAVLFRSNRWLGWAVLLGLLLDRYLAV